MSSPSASPQPEAQPQPQESGLDDMFADDEDTVMQPAEGAGADGGQPSASVSAAYESVPPTASASASASAPASRQPSRSVSRPPASMRSSASAVGEDAAAPNPLEYEEEDDADAGLQAIRITAALELPKIPELESSDRQHWILRLPEAVRIHSTPFHPDVYRAQIAESQAAEDASAHTQREKHALALKRMNEVANTVRWRWAAGEGGVPVRRSNARIVRWSDGSSLLQVGGEFWEVDNSAAQHRGQPFGGGAGVAAESQPKTNGAGAGPKGVSLLLANDRLNQVAVGQTLVAGELSLVPAGPDAIKRQQRVQLALDSTVRKAGIKTWDDGAGVGGAADLERQQAERERERRRKRGNKGAAALPVWNPRVGSGRSGGGGGGRPRASGGGGGSRRVRQSSFDSDDMDEDAGGYARGGGGGGGSGYQADGFVVSDEEDDADTRRKSKKGRSRDYNTDSDDLDEPPLEDDSDEDAPGEPEEDIDAVDAAAEAAERRRKREKKEQASQREAKRASPPRASSAMDVDSDEEVQRAPLKAKRVLQIEEEESE